MSKRILIIGGSGFIGSYLKSFFQKKKFKVITIGQRNNDINLNLSEDSRELNGEYEFIIHTAGIVHDNEHATNFNSKALLKDTSITTNTLKSIEKLDYKKFIYLSSVSIYGLESGKNIMITQNLRPKSSYGFSKYLSELIVTNKVEKNKLLILRLPLVNGPNSKGNILKARRALKRGIMFVFRNNKAEKSILEIEDLGKFIFRNYIKLSGIHQIKSHDCKFNDFINSLDEENKPIVLPLFLLNYGIRISSILRLKVLSNSLKKTLLSFTILETIKIDELE